MTFDDVQAYGRPAFLSLPNGATLGYHPEEGTVGVLGHPRRPSEGGYLPILFEDIPSEGWRHGSTCGCSRCRPDGCDVGKDVMQL